MPKTTTAPRERGILYDAAMVQALLKGRKTQTRRVFVNQPRANADNPESYSMLRSGGHGCVWDSNWRGVEERSLKTRKVLREYEYFVPLADWLAEKCPLGRVGDRLYVRETWGTIADVNPTRHPVAVRFRADGPNGAVPRWRPSIHLSRSLSRIVLTITAVRAERVQDISEEDAIAEGAYRREDGLWAYHEGQAFESPRGAFAEMWDRTNPGSLAWERNPWTSVVTFEMEVAAHG